MRSIVSLLLVLACGLAQAMTLEEMIDAKKYAYQALGLSVERPLREKVFVLPDDRLNWLKGFDRDSGFAGWENYENYSPNAHDVELVNQYVQLLPLRHRKVIEEHLGGIVFVKNFSGAAMTDWVVDEKGAIVYYIIFNSSQLSDSLSDWLTFKSDSMFEESTTDKVVVNVEGDYRALLYGLLHEVSHIVDYEMGVSPYVDTWYRSYVTKHDNESKFTEGVWVDI